MDPFRAPFGPKTSLKNFPKKIIQVNLKRFSGNKSENLYKQYRRKTSDKQKKGETSKRKANKQTDGVFDTNFQELRRNGRTKEKWDVMGRKSDVNNNMVKLLCKHHFSYYAQKFHLQYSDAVLNT